MDHVVEKVAPRGLAALALVALLLGGCRPPAIERVDPETPTPAPTATPAPTPHVPWKKLETGKIFNGLQLNATVETEHGGTATLERETPESYAVDIQVRVRVPQPTTTLEGLAELNPRLPELLPALADLVPAAKVSPFFDDLYRLKIDRIQRMLRRLDQLPSRHNFYDVETILELQDPATGRRALLAQGDMDVDMDGSDGDRLPQMEAGWTNYQPMTSYRWPKIGTTPNPFLAARETKLAELEKEFAVKGLPDARNRELSSAIGPLKLEIGDLKAHSFLISATDPYIVIPGSVITQRTPFTPRLGDYCVVIFGGSIYPAIVGDVGPTYKFGEASLRVCREINKRATAYNRPESDLKVTYLYFPGSADPRRGPPDLERIRARCGELLAEIGGHKGELHAWEDLIKPPPTPTPAPSPSPAASPDPSPSPAPAASPSPSP